MGRVSFVLLLTINVTFKILKNKEDESQQCDLDTGIKTVSVCEYMCVCMLTAQAGLGQIVLFLQDLRYPQEGHAHILALPLLLFFFWRLAHQCEPDSVQSHSKSVTASVLIFNFRISLTIILSDFRISMCQFVWIRRETCCLADIVMCVMCNDLLNWMIIGVFSTFRGQMQLRCDCGKVLLFPSSPLHLRVLSL